MGNDLKRLKRISEATRWAVMAPAEGEETQERAQELPRSTSGRLWLVLAAVLLLLVGAGVVLFRHLQMPPLTEKDSILITAVSNRTGDPVFDGTLKTALEVSLEQSPYLNVVSDRKVRDTLQLMAKPPDTPLTDDIGREICLRDGVKAMLGGSIAAFGTRYAITLKAVAADTGDPLAEEQIETSSKEHVLSALGTAATAMRGKLGESLNSLDKFDTPLQEATTSSLGALKVYSLGLARYSKGDAAGSIPLFQHAIDLDPHFASAYAALGRAHQLRGEGRATEEAIRQAYALRIHASEREKLDISAVYYQFATGQIDQTIQTCYLWTQTYPRDFVPHRMLGFEYGNLGRWEESAEDFSAAKQLDPTQGLPYAGLMEDYMALNRLAQAEAIYRQAKARKLDEPGPFWVTSSPSWRTTVRKMAEVVASVGPGPDTDLISGESDTAAYFGRLGQSRELYRRAADTFLDTGENERAAGMSADAALREALVGNSAAARQDAAAAQRFFVGGYPVWNTALALALAGDLAQAGNLTNELAKRRPDDTIINHLLLPEIRGAIEILRGKPQRAVDQLGPAVAYELGWGGPKLMSAYLRGLAYLRMRGGVQAAAEFQKILDHRGVVLNAPIAALALLNLGRAYALAASASHGDQAAPFRGKARRAYQDFLTLWNNADPDVPVLQQAKAEYRKLK